MLGMELVTPTPLPDMVGTGGAGREMEGGGIAVGAGRARSGGFRLN